MESLLIVLVGAFVLLPLPLCLWLLWDRRRLWREIEALHAQRRSTAETPKAQGTPAPPPPPDAPVAATTPPEPIAPPAEVPETTAPVPAGAFPYRKTLASAATPAAAPPPARSTPSPAARRRQAGGGFVSALRAAGLLPPAHAEGWERGVIPWLAPRLGGLLAVLAGLFLAIYVGRHAEPWVRLGQLLVAALALAGGGLFWQRKQGAVGSIVAGTGLTLLYLTSVAAYAFPATQVLDNLAAAAVLQLMALGIVGVVAHRFLGPPMVALTVGFAFASSGLATYEGAGALGLLVALGTSLGAAAYGWSMDRAVVARAGALLWPVPLLGLLAQAQVTAPVLPVAGAVLIYLLVAASLPSWRRARRSVAVGGAWARAWADLLALVPGLVLAAVYFAETETGQATFLGGAALWAAVWAMVFVWRRQAIFTFHLHALAALFFAAWWALHLYSGNTAWLALLVLAFAAAAVARWARSHWLEATLFPLLLAAAEPWWDTVTSIQREGTLAPGAWPWLALWLFPLLAWIALMLGASVRQPMRVRWAFYGVALVAGAMQATELLTRSELDPGGRILWTLGWVVLGGLAAGLLPVNRLYAWLAPIGGLAGAHAVFWAHPFSGTALVALLAVTCGALVMLFWVRERLPLLLGYGLELAAWLLMMVSLAAWVAQAPGSVAAIAGPLLVSALLMLLAGRIHKPGTALGDAALLPVLVALFVPTAPDTALLGTAGGLAALVAWVAAHRFLPIARGWELLRPAGAGHALVGLLALAWLALRLTDTMPWSAQLGFFLAAVVSLAALTMRSGPPAYRGMARPGIAGALVYLCLLSFGTVPPRLPAPEHVAAMPLLALTLGTLVILGGLLALRRTQRRSEALSDAGLALLGMATWATVIFREPVDAATFATPLLALYGATLLALGLLRGRRELRWTALALLLIPLVRLFLYDLDDTLYRIVAFAVVAALLTLIGAAYQRLGNRLG